MNGVVLIDKPAGRTSYDIVDRIKRISGIKKAGHTGTLDPLATGVLPVCINEATKLVQFLAVDQKEYRATLLLGTGTDTMDVDGKIIVRSEPVFLQADIEAALKEFIGESEQRPPRYSAIKYKGRPMYKWARSGFEMDPPVRKIEIYKIQMIETNLPYITFDVSCSKGTYIRSLCRDIGEKLGYPACLAKLRRTRSGHFFECQAVAIDGLQSGEIMAILERSMISMSDALPDLKSIALEADLAERVRQGYRPAISEIGNGMELFSSGEMVKLITGDNRLLAIVRTTDGPGQSSTSSFPGLEILRVFNRE